MIIQRRPVVLKVRDASPYQFALGLDLGQMRDHSAIVVIEQVTSRFDSKRKVMFVYKLPSTASGMSEVVFANDDRNLLRADLAPV